MKAKQCPICRENHDAERGLTFDGKGINSCGIYRARIATLTPDYQRVDVGQMFAAAPDLLAALEEAVTALEIAQGRLGMQYGGLTKFRAILSKAKGE